jgi:hypothetical protein
MICCSLSSVWLLLVAGISFIGHLARSGGIQPTFHACKTAAACVQVLLERCVHIGSTTDLGLSYPELNKAVEDPLSTRDSDASLETVLDAPLAMESTMQRHVPLSLLDHELDLSRYCYLPSSPCLCSISMYMALCSLKYHHWLLIVAFTRQFSLNISGYGGKKAGFGGRHATAVTYGPCRFVDRSSYMVPEDFSLQRAYSLFTSMGLRHLVVVDDMNGVKGIITRENITPRVLEALRHS